MTKKKGLWSNIHAKRKRGESPAKKGDKNYPETLDIGEGADNISELFGLGKKKEKINRGAGGSWKTSTADARARSRGWKDPNEKPKPMSPFGPEKGTSKSPDKFKNVKKTLGIRPKSEPKATSQTKTNPTPKSNPYSGKDKLNTQSFSSAVKAGSEMKAKPKKEKLQGKFSDIKRKLDMSEGMKTARKNVGADTCWDGYKAKGTKKKDGKEVPNCVKEGKIADRMRANLNKKKAEWDEKGNKATKDGYDALDKVKKTQADLDKSDFTNNIKEGKTFAEFCVEGKSRIETDPDYRKRFKALADSFAEKRKEQTKAKMKKESVEILDVDGNMVAEITDLISPEPMTGWKQQNEEYKKLPKRKMGMKAGKKIISAVGHAGKSGAEEEGTIENQVRMQKAEKKVRQADKIHSKAKDHSEPLSRMKSLKNKLKGKLKEDWSKKNKGDKVDGMGKDSIKAYRRENPGSKLQGAVTGNPKKGSKDADRRKNYCDRSKGQQDMHNIDCSSTPDKPICKARKRWKC